MERAAFSYERGLYGSLPAMARSSAYSERIASTCSLVRGMRLGDEPGQEGLLRMQPVLRLVPHGGVRTIDHLVGDLLAPVRGQAVQHQDVLLRPGHHGIVDAVRGE